MIAVHGPDEPDLRRVELGLIDQADTLFWLARVAFERLAPRGVDAQEAFRDAASELREEDPRRLDEFERGMGRWWESRAAWCETWSVRRAPGATRRPRRPTPWPGPPLDSFTNSAMLAVAAGRER